MPIGEGLSMKTSRTLTIAAAAIAVTAVIGTTAYRHFGDRPAAKRNHAQLATPQLPDAAIADAVRQAGIDVTSLSVRNVGGIVILRGHAEPGAAEKAGAVVKSLGFTRVANLIATNSFDDEGIRRTAERQLANTRGLDGCTLKVSCERGVLRLQGTARSELQVDLARTVLRHVNGAQDVKVELLQPVS
jgi:osmotically-inducible protein OsmY